MSMINTLNEAIAVSLTRVFGSMWLVYVFMCYGLLPVFPQFHPFQDTLLYWGNVCQLIALPLLAVGTNILGRAAEERAKYDHEKLARTYEEQTLIYQDIVQMMARQETMMADLDRLSCHPKNLG